MDKHETFRPFSKERIVFRLPNLSLRILFAAGVLGCGLLIDSSIHDFTASRAETVKISPRFSKSGPARVGGSFTLTSHLGNRTSTDSFRGKYMLVYFGYTYCPDICPSELQKISSALDQLGDKSARIQPLFITVDPRRDTAEVLADYVSHFHSSLIGLTGSPDEIETATKAYRVLYRTAGDVTGSDYLIGHSSNIFLMDEKGEYATHFPYGSTVEEIVTGLTRQLDQ